MSNITARSMDSRAGAGALARLRTAAEAEATVPGIPVVMHPVAGEAAHHREGAVAIRRGAAAPQTAAAGAEPAPEPATEQVGAALGITAAMAEEATAMAALAEAAEAVPVI